MTKILGRCLIVMVGLGLNVAAYADTTAFVNVNVITMTDEQVRAGQTVVVAAGEIKAIGPAASVSVPKGAQIVDGTDRYLLPGLAELHAHVPGASSDSLSRTLTLFVANGVTTIRGMLGQASHLGLRESLASGDTFGPRLITSGPSLNGTTVNSPAEGERKVRAQFDAGYDFLKIHPGLTADEFNTIAATANALGMRFAGHVPSSVGLQGALDVGMATIDHLDGYLFALMPDGIDSSEYGSFFDELLTDQRGRERIAEWAAKTAAAGTWNVPTESLFENQVSAISVAELSNLPEMRYMPAATVEQWANSKRNQESSPDFDAKVMQQAVTTRRLIIKALHDAGAGLLLGADAPQVFNVPGFAAHHELKFLVAAGLTPYEALATGTIAAAEFLGTNTGSVEVGRDADLLLLDANPLVDIDNTRQIRGVMLAGNWYPANELQRRLEPFKR